MLNPIEKPLKPPVSTSFEPSLSVRRLKLVITELDFGGAEQRLVDLATNIDRQHFEPSVISLAPRPDSASDQLVRRLEDAEVPVKFLDARGMVHSLRTWWRLRREFRVNPCDLVQSFLFHANVFTGLTAPRQVDHFAGVRVADPRKGRLLIERRVLRRSKKIVCVSNSVADHLLQNRHSTDQLVTIPNGIDAESMDAAIPVAKRELGIPHDAVMVAVMGRLDEQKGTDWLIEQVDALARANQRLHFVFCGRGDVDHYRRLAQDHGVAERTHFLGWREDVPGILKSSDLLMLPSRWEGMPNVVLEAMALRVPVLATPTHGVMELLGPTARKMTFEEGDSKALLDRATHWLNSQDASDQQLLDDNRYRAVHEFSIAKMVRQYERLYGVTR